MLITIFGATGRVGSRIVDEALARGHDITAVSRHSDGLDKLPVTVATALGDASEADEVARLSEGQDLVISATSAPTGEDNELAAVAEALLDGTARVGVRLIVVGGAGPLVVPGSEGTIAVDDPKFVSESARDVAMACVEQFEVFRGNTTADWTYLSPAAEMQPGERTGTFRTGTDELIVDDDGRSRISMEDLAVALIDEAETPVHRRDHLTVGY